MNIGYRIAEMRKRKKLSQQELADKLFVSDKTISSWEANRTEPSLAFVAKMSEFFDCNISYLVYGEIKRNDIETEIRFKLTEKEYKELELFFKNNAIVLGENKQLDTYFQPTYRAFINHEKIQNKEEIKEWLRIGKRGNKFILNYKNWHVNYCDEYEVELDNNENLMKIFTVLGLEELIKVEKVRKTYCYLEKYEIALDSIKDLGYFIEIEVKKYSESILNEYDTLLKMAKDFHLNLDLIDNRGYPYLLIEQKYNNME